MGVKKYCTYLKKGETEDGVCGAGKSYLLIN